LKVIQQILKRYTAFLWLVLKPLGAWGVFVIAGLDAAALGLPMDVIVAGYVYQDRSRFLLYVFMASAGSALGSIVLYVIGYTGGEALLRKRVSPERFEKIHGSFAKHPFWALMFPAILPPPTPFKLFVLAAAVSEMPFVNFLLAIFSGRFVRFLILSVLTMKFGPQVVQLTATLVREHLRWVLAAAALGLAVWLVWWRRNRTKKKAPPAHSENASGAQR
jgi:membrane protein YqaA with SNARE-associated domain